MWAALSNLGYGIFMQAWATEGNKMINNYEAPVAPEDVGTIVDYLTALKGAK
jgi:hypothetical protein